MQEIVAFTGPRDLVVSRSVIQMAVKRSGFVPEKVVFGDATGIDSCVMLWQSDLPIQSQQFFAEWDHWGAQGKRHYAGPERNRRMLKAANRLIAIRRKGEKTRGTSDCIKQALAMGMDVYLVEIDVASLYATGTHLR